MWENETGADAAPAGQMGNEIVGSLYLLGPSIHPSRPASRPTSHPSRSSSCMEKERSSLQFGGGEPPEATTLVLTGEAHSPHPLHLSPEEDDSVAEA